MRLGAPLDYQGDDPFAYFAAHLQKGYGAAYCPVIPLEQASAFAQAAQAAGVVIAEVGAWCNPLDPDEDRRRRNIALCQERLALAEAVGARCCVNIAGSRGPKWDGPDPRDLSEETFERVVETTRTIIDAVRPSRSCYALETMPWMFPDSIESYTRLLRAIDRPGFGVHFDPVNLINCPERYFHNAAYLRRFVRELGGQIRSVHLKDILLADQLTVHLSEVRPGMGGLDYPALLKELDGLDPDLPVMCEHLPSAEEYDRAVSFVRSAAAQAQARIL